MNYNVYLVEDEYMLREYVKASTIWKNGPYVLCGDASNGEDAWEDIQALSVDILLTDIKMPFMDGLELSRLIRKNRPEIRVIILSGYDDFSYAKQALALGVTDYLLKPLKPEDLLNTLQRTAQMIDAERRQIQSMRTLQEIANESLELNCHKFFAQLCRGFLSEQRISSELQRLHLRMDAACYSGCILALHELGKAETDDEAYLAFLDCSQIIRTFSESRPDCFWYPDESGEFCFIVLGDMKDDVLEKARSYLKAIQASLSAELGFTRMTAVLGTPADAISNLYVSMLSAKVAYSLLHIPQSEQHILLAEDCGRTLPSMQYTNAEKRLFRSLLVSGSLKDIPDVVEALVQKLESAQMSHLYLTYICLDLLTSVSDFIKELGGKNDIAPELDVPSIAQMFSYDQDLTKFQTALTNLATQAISLREQNKGGKNDNIIQQAKDYIMEHFTDPELDLSVVAKHVNINPSYLSTLFRQETGQCFIEFLTLLRINRAKELLRTTQMRTSDIAFEVGYADQNYFSKLFKKCTGMSTREFRQS